MSKKAKNALQEQESLARALLIFVGIMFFIYNLSVKWLNVWLHMTGDIVINVCLSLFLLLSSLLFAVRYHIHIWRGNVRFNTIVHHFFDAFAYSTVVIWGIVLLKVLLLYLHHLPICANTIFQPTMQFTIDHIRFSYSRYFYYIGAYAISSFLQEFIARGVIQNTLERIFLGGSKWWPIITVSLFFGAMHGHKAVFFALFTFFLSMFWGWLYNKQHTLISVCFSHILIGISAAFIIGVQQLLV